MSVRTKGNGELGLENNALERLLDVENRVNLIQKYGKMLSIGILSRNDIENVYDKLPIISDSTDKPNKELIKEIFNSKPLVLLNRFIPSLVTKEIHKEVDVYLDTENYRDKSEFPYTISLKAKEFSVVTSVGHPFLEFHSYGEDYSFDIKHVIDLDRFNHLSKEIHLKGKFIQSESVSHNAFESLDKTISVNVTGLLIDVQVPSWVEYLVEGCINIEYGNNKMALFNIFASLDKFIELLNEVIFDYYIKHYNELIKQLAITKEDEFEISLYLKTKIRKFGKENRRIIEKLKDALKEVGINGKNEGFYNMFSLIKKVEEIEKIRNKIGHGEKIIERINVGEVLYTVLTIIFSSILYTDMEDEDWKTIIVEE